jgi:dCTP deaminase
VILTGPEIVRIINRTKEFREGGYQPPLPIIDIEPFDEKFVGPNSVDVHLGSKLLTYQLFSDRDLYAMSIIGMVGGAQFLDPEIDNPTTEVTIPPQGMILHPGRLYLGSTVEWTETQGLVPWIDGRSSIGRLGLGVHVTAGRGDSGFRGRWTLEITCVHPIRVKPGMRIAQISFFRTTGDLKPYSGKYQNSDGVVPSRLWQDPDAKETQ